VLIAGHAPVGEALQTDHDVVELLEGVGHLPIVTEVSHDGSARRADGCPGSRQLADENSLRRVLNAALEHSSGVIVLHRVDSAEAVGTIEEDNCRPGRFWAWRVTRSAGLAGRRVS
jgi:hypothetical protein